MIEGNQERGGGGGKEWEKRRSKGKKLSGNGTINLQLGNTTP